MDYTHYYKERLDPDGGWGLQWDVFVSAYNSSERVQRTFGHVCATKKLWVLHPEYAFPEDRPPPANCISSTRLDEADFIRDCFDPLLEDLDPTSDRMCVDITGFMRPHLMFLIKYLFAKGAKQFDVLYSEPLYYRGLATAQFSGRSVSTVRQVSGFEGVVNNDTSNDVLVIGAGYESHLMAEVAEDKDRAERVLVLGLPSLGADMYQQSALRIQEAADALGEGLERFYAPANDPFVTATVISDLVKQLVARKPITNLFLSPLATKAQALGFALFHINECTGHPASIIFPYSSSYSSDNTTGISRVWRYVVECS